MKKTIFYLAIASISFLACSKSDDSNPTSASAESNTVFYTDTFNIYSTDLKGGNRKLVTSEGPNTNNNYIYATAYVPTANRLVYVYTEKYDKPFFLKTCKLDGSDKKTIKTFPAFTRIGLVKATSDGLIFYTLPGNPFPNQTPSKTFSIKADGTGETEITQQVYNSISDTDLISADGKGILSTSGYFFKLVNGTFDEANSFNILLNEEKDQTKIKELMISADALKVAFMQKTAVAGQYEIRIKDLIKNAPVSKVIYTVNLPSDSFDFSLEMCFVNGSKNILIKYGKFTSPQGSPNDFTNCELIDAATGNVTQTWKFMGDDIGSVLTN